MELDCLSSLLLNLGDAARSPLRCNTRGRTGNSTICSSMCLKGVLFRPTKFVDQLHTSHAPTAKMGCERKKKSNSTHVHDPWQTSVITDCDTWKKNPFLHHAMVGDPDRTRVKSLPECISAVEPSPMEENSTICHGDARLNAESCLLVFTLRFSDIPNRATAVQGMAKHQECLQAVLHLEEFAKFSQAELGLGAHQGM